MDGGPVPKLDPPTSGERLNQWNRICLPELVGRKRAGTGHVEKALKYRSSPALMSVEMGRECKSWSVQAVMNVGVTEEKTGQKCKKNQKLSACVPSKAGALSCGALETISCSIWSSSWLPAASDEALCCFCT